MRANELAIKALSLIYIRQVINVLTVLSIYVPQLTHDQCWAI